MRKSSLLCQSLDEKLEESLTEKFMDLMAHVESLESVPRDERDVLLRHLAELQGDVDALAGQMNLLDMSLLDARKELRAKDDELRRAHITNPGVFAELYDKGEVLGKGKFGVVYECTPKHDPTRRCAVKVLSCKGEAMRDLNNEVRLLSCVRAPNIVQLVETFLDAEWFYLVMERVEGGELFDVLATVAHYSEQESRDAFRQLMQALIVLRHHQVVHRDLVRC
jgi:serine/threonine protein kinase